MKDAIERSMKAGYDPDLDDPVGTMLLDRSFWEFLSKAEGWDEHDKLTQSCYLKTGAAGEMSFKLTRWSHYKHHMIDWLDEGKEIDDFFKKILK